MLEGEQGACTFRICIELRTVFMIKNKKSKIMLTTICIVIFLCIPIALVTPTQLSLVFYKENSTNIAAYLPIKQGEEFDIIFTHSIHLTDVVEKYQVTESNEIMQTEIIYEEFGIGMPSNALEGEVFEHKNGKYHVKDLHNVFPTMNIRNGKTVSKHRLVWEDDKGNHQVYFNDFFEPGAWFKVKVERLPLFKTWKEVKIHD